MLCCQIDAILLLLIFVQGFFGFQRRKRKKDVCVRFLYLINCFKLNSEVISQYCYLRKM